MISLLITIAGVHLVALMSPGPDVFFVSQTAMSKSRSAAMCGVIGITLGMAFWSALSIQGLQILFEHFAWLQKIIMTAGGLYLCWIGFSLLKSVFAKPAGDTAKLELKDSCFKTFLFGLFVNLSNPKALIYFSSIFSLFITPGMDTTVQIWIFALVVAEAFLWFAFVALVLGMPVCRRKYQNVSRWIDFGAGALFMLFGGALCIESIRS